MTTWWLLSYEGEKEKNMTDEQLMDKANREIDDILMNGPASIVRENTDADGLIKGICT